MYLKGFILQSKIGQQTLGQASYYNLASQKSGLSEIWTSDSNALGMFSISRHPYL